MHTRHSRILGCLLVNVFAASLVVACGEDESSAPDTGAARDDAGVADTGAGDPDLSPGPDGGLDPDMAPPVRPKLNEWCNIQSAACESGLACLGGLCQQPCDASKGIADNADCPTPADYFCDATAALSICRLKCDPEKGEGNNPACPVGQSCTESEAMAPGFCSYTANPPKRGTLQLGQACWPSADLSTLCDAKAGLYCSADAFPKCVKACDIRQGEANNPECASGETCVENLHSFKQGRCAAAPSKKLGEWCDNIDAQCLGGLTCMDNVCHTGCVIDEQQNKGIADNPDCGTAPNEFWCRATLEAAGCHHKCDPEQGIVANPKCPAKTYCVPSTEDYAPGYCEGFLNGPMLGSAQKGASCSRVDPTRFCASGLACVDETCVTACDPKAADPHTACGTVGEVCHEAMWTHTGGYCAAKGSKKLNERCNNLDQLCESGLVCNDLCVPDCAAAGDAACPDDGREYWCVSSWTSDNRVMFTCANLCDPTKGTGENPDCAVGATCFDWGGDGVCFNADAGLPGTKQLGDFCSLESASTRCDNSKGLACDVWGVNWGDTPSYRCLKTCDMREGIDNNSACQSGEQCLLGIGALGGSCLPAPSKDLGQQCDGSLGRCKDGLACINGVCFQGCDETKGTENNTDCPAPQASFHCSEWTGDFGLTYGHVCRKACDTTKGSLENPVCDTGSGCRGFDDVSGGPGYCEPTALASIGKQKLGEACVPPIKANPDTANAYAAVDDQCDGSLDLACVAGTDTCEATCDPTNQHQDCAQGQLCAKSWLSPSGGYCL